MAKLQLSKLAAGWFLATVDQGHPEQWTRVKLRVVLANHGYSLDETDVIVEQAESAPDLEVHLPDRC